MKDLSLNLILKLITLFLVSFFTYFYIFDNSKVTITYNIYFLQIPFFALIGLLTYFFVQKKFKNFVALVYLTLSLVVFLWGIKYKLYNVNPLIAFYGNLNNQIEIIRNILLTPLCWMLITIYGILEKKKIL